MSPLIMSASQWPRAFHEVMEIEMLGKCMCWVEAILQLHEFQVATLNRMRINELLTSMWRTLPSLLLEALDFPEVESVKSLSRHPSPRSSSKLRMPIAKVEPRTMAYSSASPELRANTLWVDDQVLMRCCPNWMAPPLVDFLPGSSPAQSESTKI